MYTIDYTSYVSGGFGYHMDVFDKIFEADSIFDVLGFMDDLEIDSDYTKVHAVYCGTRELNIDKLCHYVEHYDFWKWLDWHKN